MQHHLFPFQRRQNMLYVGTDGNGVHFIATDRRKVVRTMRHETVTMKACVPIPFIRFGRPERNDLDRVLPVGT